MSTGNQNRQALQNYRQAIEGKLRNHPYEVGELAFRADFENLFSGFESGVYRALHEPLGVAIGQPDFVIQRNAIPVGYIECKDIGTDLVREETSEQLTRYRDGLHNLILTDYLSFRWYVDGEFRREVRLASRQPDGSLQRVPSGYQDVELLLQDFLSQDISLVDNPKELAQRMALKARLLRDTSRGLVEAEARQGRVLPLLRTYRDLLVADLRGDAFADMYAQTATYGLFAAWQRHPIGAGPFTRQSAVFTQMTPFLQETLGQVAGPRTQRELSWIIDDIAQLLDRTNREAIMAGFARGPGQDDPIIHFYEDFLAAYDPKLRETRGVYFTPLPVVSYIVRSIGYLLRDSFDIQDGLADSQRVSDGEFHRVTILDPAVGTGTFLREVVANVRETIQQKGLGGIWPQYVKDDLLPRLHGFELLMAPYTISHLSLAITLDGIEIGDDEINVILTNSLEPAHRVSADPASPDESYVEAESSRADKVKRDRPVMVVLGNPPYSGTSANEGIWIRDLLNGIDMGMEVESYFMVGGEPLNEKLSKWLYDDYVKFIRFAQWRIDRTGEGILGFVTNHSWLDNPTFRGMRRSLMETFDDIYILDLHGNALKREKAPDGGKDENVFDIRQGVAISLFVKRAKSGSGLASVHHSQLWGKRTNKYGWLEEHSIRNSEWSLLAPRHPQYFFVPRDEQTLDEYENAKGIRSIFPINVAGIITARDKLTIQWSADDMVSAATDFAQLDVESARSKYSLGDDGRNWKVAQAQEDIRERLQVDRRPDKIQYRAFDVRYTYYTGRGSGFMSWPRPQVMRHMLAGRNLGLITSRQVSVDSGYSHAIATRHIVDNRSVYTSRGIMSLIPLYLYPTDMERERGIGVRPNLDTGFIEELSEATDLEFKRDGPGDLESTFGPEDVFHYIYAILHSPSYRTRYADFLKSDFPRIPLTRNRVLFGRLIALGKRLTELHLMEEEPKTQPSFPIEGNLHVNRLRFAESPDGGSGQVYINNNQYFDGVRPDIWGFTIGGYRPAEKWLKDRKGRTLTADDVRHYRKMCGALAETQELMAEIDKAINGAGGWPLK